MMNTDLRLTLVARGTNKPDADWKYTPRPAAQTVFIESLPALKIAVATGTGLDIERVVVDRASCAAGFLDLLTAIPHFTGDVVLIRDSGDGFLSATVRGGDRILYALTSDDVRFYLETHDLVTGRTASKLSA